MSVSDLPALNASLNALATILLTAGFVFIKQRQVSSHRLCMVSAFVVSCVFLVTYVLHKILMRGVHTPFGGEGAIRTIYYTMLISHIILAIVIVPLVLATLRYAVHNQIEQLPSGLDRVGRLGLRGRSGPNVGDGRLCDSR